MKVVGEFNKISSEMKKMLPQLKKGEVATFQLVNGVINNDPDLEWRKKNPVHYATWQIPTRDRIKDWHTGEFIDIGVPESFSRNEVQTTKFYMPGLGEPHYKNTGLFSLSGNKMADIEMYEYLSMTNSNESNPHRDESVEPIFKELNEAKSSKALIDQEDVLTEAIISAKEMSVEQAREFAASLVWPNYKDESTLLSKVRTYARQNPEDFIRISNDPNTKIKAELKDALDKDILDYDITQQTMSMGKTVLASLNIREGSDFMTAFHEFIQTSPNGNQVLESIRKQLKAKNKKAEAATT